MLRESSQAESYYFGDLPGTLQYELEPSDILNLETDLSKSDLGFSLDFHTKENLQRLIPNTKKGKENNWKLLFVMKKDCGNNVIWIKGALQNKENGKICLMSSTNRKENIENNGNRAIKSMDKDWFIGHYRMAAPMIFWQEIKNRLTN